MFDIFFIGGKNYYYQELKSKFFFLKHANNFLEAQEKCLTDFFWIVYDDLIVDENFNFDYVPDSGSLNYNHVFLNAGTYDGVALIPKHNKISTTEILTRQYRNQKQVPITASIPRSYEKYIINSYDDYLFAIENSKTELFWCLNNNLEILKEFKFDLYFSHDNQYDRKQNHVFVHRVNNINYFNGVFLLSKARLLTKKEIEHRFLFERKEWDIVASGPKKYDQFVIDTYAEYLQALENSTTEMFWGISKNITVDKNFHFDVYFTHDNEYDRKQNHAFLHVVNNKQTYDGIFLFSKHKTVIEREIEYRHLIERKEWDIVASGPKLYDRFVIDTYAEYLQALENTTTEMFWGTSRNIEVSQDFQFDLYFDNRSDEYTYERNENHVFIHKVNNINHYKGIFLFSKNKPVTEREIEHRHLVERKEWDIVASGPKLYDRFVIDTYDEYQHALENTTTEMFWGTSRNIEIAPNFEFDLFFDDRDDSCVYERNTNHVFVHRVNDKDYYSGVFLFSKNKPVTEREIEHRHLVERKEWDIVASGPKLYDQFTIDSYDEYQHALENTTTEMFWGYNSKITIDPNFKFNTYFTHDNEYDRKQNHAFLHRVSNKQTYDGVFLFSKHKSVTQKEIEHRHIMERKEWDIIASGPKYYDRFVVDTYEEYLHALKNSTTEMFWATSRNISIADEFKFDLFFDDRDDSCVYERNTNHVFVHRVNDKDYYSGVFLFSKYKPVSKKEIDRRFIVDKKEWDIIASGPKYYDQFVVDTYEEYLHALKTSTTEMFWGYNSKITIDPNFKFNMYFTHDNEYDRKQNHAFLHRVSNKQTYDGVLLFSKHKTVTEQEIKYRHLIERKEWDIVASGPKLYDRFVIDTYEEYLQALENTTTEMFWGTSRNIEVLQDFQFDLYFDNRSDEYTYERNENHAFIHKVDGNDYYNGLFLFSKNKPVSEREIEHRHLIDRKEWDIVASGPKLYDRFVIDTYADYQHALENTTTELFYATSANIKIKDFAFNHYFTHDNEYDRKQNHAFLHKDGNETKYNGVYLLSKYNHITQKEIEHRHIVNYKPWAVVASEYKIYDVVFISYQEPNADENYKLLLDKVPNAKRVHGIKGIHQAHIAAATQCETEMFWIVDGDAVLTDDFDFSVRIPKWDRDAVHVWRSKNPVNDLVYGYGGVKLFPRMLTVNMDVSKPDMTTSITNKFKAVNQISNITAFNTDPFNTWKSAFRECVKLSSKTIDRQKDSETDHRLYTWCSKGLDQVFGKYSIDGAKQGAVYGTRNKENLDALKMINNFDWLKEQFDARNI